MNDDDVAKVLAGARREEVPPADIEMQTVTALRAAGLIGHDGRRRMRSRVATVLAIAATLIVGVWIGTRQARWFASNQPKFLLLLYEPAGYQNTDRAGNAKREAEYTAWIRALARAGHALEGEKVEWGGAELRPNQPTTLLDPSPAPNEPDGFFIILASDENAAVAIAETCPHLKYGGRVVLKSIRP